MVSAKTILFFAAAVSASVIGLEGREDAEHPEACGSAPYPDELLEMTAFFKDEDAKLTNGSMSIAAAPAPGSSQVFIHVVSAQQSTFITDDMINRQFAMIRDEWKKHGWTMTLAGKSKTVNSNWATDKDQLNMKKKLRKGAYRDLNVYVIDKIGTGGTTGYCYYPTSSHATGGTNFYQDGCTIIRSTVPVSNDDKVKNGKGKTLIHEVGHWLGLKHVFEGGCDGAGDGIADTPAQKDAYWTCAARDSCPGNAGSDPIHNYMGYTMGTCRTGFTKGQITRMKTIWKTVRAT
ncbi:unnamed protein product [Clonostachys chloroleuca]|uniref:Peptidase M43 pregnancy-associated plasma-A domain-containing protein n=1 Tax=Clonostachys chloroleuca TaxID=1926264 RepID=A0AA35M7Y5_9HYPO|nr:unnamed protein product [Clonostachys chloroleuca]